MKTQPALLLSALLLSALAACDRGATPPEPEGANAPAVEAVSPVSDPEPDPVPPMPAPETPPPPAATAAAAAEALPPPEPVGPDEQMQEDAEATGMTARVARGEDAEDAGNAPADAEAEEK